MGKAKEPYWTYVKSIIKEYPELKKEISTPREARLSAVYGFGGGRGSNIANPTMNCVIHDLPPKKQRKYDAISLAIEKTKVLHPVDAEERLKVIDLVYWRKSHTIEGAAMRVPCHRNVAGNWQGEFIKLVAEELELV